MLMEKIIGAIQNEKLKELRENALFLTDFYQVSMTAVYFAENRHNEEVVFEAFVRSIRDDVTNKGRYIFSGEKELKLFIECVKYDIINKKDEIRNKFIQIVKAKGNGEAAVSLIQGIKTAFDNGVTTEFEYFIITEGTAVLPMVPVFMFRGPRWIGQMIETMVTNIINGKTGYKTYENDFSIDDVEREFYKNITASLFETINEESLRGALEKYTQSLVHRAEEYREVTDKGIMEAGYRRAPGFFAAVAATYTALENRWDGTSNTTAYFIENEDNMFIKEKIGGSFAHSFVMAYENEIEAFKIWNKYWPASVLLIDTYNVETAAKTVREYNEKQGELVPEYVRIDSEPLKEYGKKVREIFDEYEITKRIKIYLSSDITPEMIMEFKKDNVPFDRLMAGTKYVNVCGMNKINPGFVYKLTVNNEKGKITLPEKKAEGKKNYPGAKHIIYDYVAKKVDVRVSFNGKIGYTYIGIPDNQIKNVSFSKEAGGETL